MKTLIAIGSGNNISAEAVVFNERLCQDTSHLDSDLEGKILICLSSVGREFLQKCFFLGVAGIVVPSVHYKDWISIDASSGMVVYILNRFGWIGLEKGDIEVLSKYNNKKVEISKLEGHKYELSLAS